jgi:hypothetical protein
MPSIARRVAPAIAGLAALGVLHAVSARADLLLNEVLYDPAGADEGHEFVELWNPDSTALPLDGLAIEAGDGARPGSWDVIWRGAVGAAAPPRSPLLVDGDALLGALQNGPDAVRLTRNGVVLDLLGYGELSAAALYEGSPAPDADSGQSLARLHDGVDTQDNAADWAAEGEPTPGLANHPDYRLRLSRSGLLASPEVAWPGDPVAIRACARNEGLLAVDAARWELVAEWTRDASPGGLGAGSASADSSVAWAPVDSGVAWAAAASHDGITVDSGDSAVVSLAVTAPAPGVWRLRARIVCRVDLADSPQAGLRPDTLEVMVRSVAGPAVVNEFAFRDAGAGEWIEIWFRDPVDDVGAFSIADATAAPRPIDRGALPRAAPAGALLVVAQDPALVRARFGLPDSIVLGVAGGWPSLNDTGGDDGIADRVRIVGKDGVPCDAAPYRGAASARGGSLERLSADFASSAAGTWAETIDPKGGTPGRENSMRAPGASVAARGPLLVAGGRVVRRGNGGAVPVVLRTTPAARGRRLTVRVHDLLGRPVRTLVEGQRFASDGAFVWDGRNDHGDAVAPGLYVIRAEALPEDDAAIHASSVPMAVAP